MTFFSHRRLQSHDHFKAVPPRLSTVLPHYLSHSGVNPMEGVTRGGPPPPRTISDAADQGFVNENTVSPVLDKRIRYLKIRCVLALYSIYM